MALSRDEEDKDMDMEEALAAVVAAVAFPRDDGPPKGSCRSMSLSERAVVLRGSERPPLLPRAAVLVDAGALVLRADPNGNSHKSSTSK